MASISLLLLLLVLVADPDRLQRLPKRSYQVLVSSFIAGVLIVVASSSVQTAKANDHAGTCDEMWRRFIAAPESEFKLWAIWDKECR